jgi:hypothetical protein
MRPVLRRNIKHDMRRVLRRELNSLGYNRLGCVMRPILRCVMRRILRRLGWQFGKIVSLRTTSQISWDVVKNWRILDKYIEMK